jgi:hypothetical protein
MQSTDGRKAGRRPARWLAACALLIALAGCGGGGGGSSSVVAGTSIRGHVLDESSAQPIAGATVTAGTHSARTGRDGTFALATEPGTVVFTVSAPDYLTGSFSAVVQPDQPAEVGELRLTNIANGPPPPPP